MLSITCLVLFLSIFQYIFGAYQYIFLILPYISKDCALWTAFELLNKRAGYTGLETSIITTLDHKGLVPENWAWNTWLRFKKPWKEQ